MEENEVEDIDMGDLLSGLGMDKDETWAPDTLTFFGPEKRSICFAGEVTEESATVIISQLFELNSRDNEEPIYLYINTGGGDLVQGLAIYDVIRSLECPVVGIALGGCQSAGLIILSSCDLRYSYPSTTFMYHNPIFGDLALHTPSSSKEINRIYNYYSDLCLQIVRQRAGLTEQEWEESFGDNNETHFFPAEALELGIIDKIVEFPKKNLKAL